MKIIDRYILGIPSSLSVLPWRLLHDVRDLDLFDRFPGFSRRSPIQDVLLYYFYYLFAVKWFVPFVGVVLPIARLLQRLYTRTLFSRHQRVDGHVPRAASASGG